jgi:hypothetical protein
MQPANQFDQPVTTDELQHSYRLISLVRPSGTRVRFEGLLLADAHNRTDHIPVWHELALYQKPDSSFVVTICVRHRRNGFDDALHVFNATTFEMVMDIVERYRDSITVEGVVRTRQADDPVDAPPILRSVVVENQIKQIRRHYEALVGDFLFAANRFNTHEPVTLIDLVAAE